MDLYYTLAGALVIGTFLLIGSGVVYVGTRIEHTVREVSRPATRRSAASAVGIALVVALWLGFGSFSFSHAFDRTADAYVPPAGVDWEPAGAAPAPATRFDRFDYGSVSNAALSRRS